MNDQSFGIPIVSTKASSTASGTVKLKLGFVPPSELHEFPDYQEIYREIMTRANVAQPTLVSAPPVGYSA